MNIKLGKNAYGKNAVNLSKIIRHEGYNEFRQVSVNVSLEGDFETAHTLGDNTKILPTDTQKNTVYVLAKEFFTGSIEDFGKQLAVHFFRKNQQISTVTIGITEHLYARIPYGGTDHPYAFISSGDETHTTKIVQNASGVHVSSAINNLLIVKTTDSGFENYISDQYTTLQETNDRIMATRCEASWEYYSLELDYSWHYKTIRAELLRVFAEHQSLSLQQTMYAMGEAILEKNEAVKEISFKMPNKHHILFNLEQFGIDNNNEIFIATDEPYGYITATIVREG
ncbi:MAG: factor-independent urate hydroxylase [Chitinophagaceae bacterium]